MYYVSNSRLGIYGGGVHGVLDISLTRRVKFEIKF